MFPVCGNSFRMLQESRFAPHFDFFGNTQVHYGIFDGCGTWLPFDTIEVQATSGDCC
jgi:hypothetical protein